MKNVNKKVRTSYTFDRELYEKLKSYSDKNMATMNKVVVRALENFLNENEGK
ncbi:MAG: hypothetical protein RSG52_15735 [Terrisporobacter sp.]|uniref:hypothetical protein n=1 Tax=Terrisporobacter sp. TaxID=1965305 RepID=UPI002FC74F61